MKKVTLGTPSQGPRPRAAPSHAPVGRTCLPADPEEVPGPGRGVRMARGRGAGGTGGGVRGTGGQGEGSIDR